ncbi:MAG: nucleotidyltransferase family protein [Clostridia bacterium]|nr:nucleotidyltransferase family protein [Clostridia bacterium]
MTTEQLLIALLRAVLSDTPFCEPISFATFKAVYQLAATHDLKHLVYTAAETGGVLPTPSNESEQAFLEKAAASVEMAQYRYAKLEAELDHVGAVFRREGIAYLPLKGAVLRVLYPEPWMRTSCDIDVLVHEEDLDRAVDALVAEGFTTDGVRNYHDLSLYCDGVHVELHHNVLERIPAMDAVLATIWEHTVSKGCYHVEKPAFFLFHHLAHMAYHFLGGGCGVRTVMDLWLLLSYSRCSSDEVLTLCKQGGLSVFAEQLCALAAVWFGDGEHTDMTRKAEQFILNGGAYGSREQGSAATAARYGTTGAIWRKVWMPYADLKQAYPQVADKPYLTPYYQAHRVITRLKQGRGAKAIERLRAVSTQSDEAVAETRELLSQLGLYEVSE